MNTTEQAVSIEDRIEQLRRNKNPALALKNLAMTGCRRCHGRGHLGWNDNLSRYEVCRCVRNRVRDHRAGSETSPVEAEVRRQDVEKADRAIVHNAERLKRLEEMLDRERGKLSELQMQAAPYVDKSPDEENAELEAEFAAMELAKREAAADGYERHAGEQRDAAEIYEQEIARLGKLRRKALAEAREADGQCQRIRSEVASAAAEQRQTHGKRMAELGGERKRMLHKITRKVRQQEVVVDRLTIRAGKCKIAIDSALLVVEQHSS